MVKHAQLVWQERTLQLDPVTGDYRVSRDYAGGSFMSYVINYGLMSCVCSAQFYGKSGLFETCAEWMGCGEIILSYFHK